MGVPLDLFEQGLHDLETESVGGGYHGACESCCSPLGTGLRRPLQVDLRAPAWTCVVCRRIDSGPPPRLLGAADRRLGEGDFMLRTRYDGCEPLAVRHGRE